uniref:Sushi domain-containing protein n=1 Tax=Oncorhynchus mykiss TaxID=8022 RepID=A0A8L0DT83_ONCMY
MFYSFHFYCIYHLINMKSSLTLLCLVVWVNVDASSAQTEYCGKPEGEGRRMLPIPNQERYENGDQVEYGCLATCKNGEWDKTIKGKDYCSKPEGADTRMLLIPDRERYENGDKIDYGCLSGPNKGSRGKATCKNGEWSKTIECQAFAKCALSLPPTRGTSYTPADRNLFLPDESVTVTCASGFWNSFSRQTENTMTCKEDGKWSSSTDCEPSCPDPPPITNGDFTKEKRDVEGVITEVSYQCSRQFTLSFTGSIRCLDGKWPSPPKCLRMYIIFNWSEHGVISTYHKTLTCENGSWTTPPPTCKQYCGKPEGAGKQIQILDQELERYENGNQIDYTCINPHKGPGGTATCNNGEWHMPIECKASCPDPPPITNGDFTKEKRDVEGVITEVSYQCSRQFTLSFTGSIRCLDGKWPSPPKCLQYCGKPEGAGRRMEIPDQVLERYENGNQIDYTCINPYKGPGGTATCKNGEWHMPVECNASCPDPPPITNGDFTKEKRDVEGVITEVSYQCSIQFTLSFTGSIRCLDGKWQSPPKCLRMYIIYNWSEHGVISTCQVYINV